MTWFQQSNAYSLWGEAANNSSDDQRRSEKYQAGARTRHNLSTQNFLFAQGSWLSDRYNGYRSRDTLVAGYGRQVLTGPIHTLRVEAGPGVSAMMNTRAAAIPPKRWVMRRPRTATS